MKFNSKELASFAAYRIGRADKEGSLWMRESDGIIRKKESKPFTLSLSLPSLASQTIPQPTVIWVDGGEGSGTLPWCNLFLKIATCVMT